MLHADACPRGRGVFQSRWHTEGRTACILPPHFCHRPHRFARLNGMPFHAICIGKARKEFSYWFFRFRRTAA